MSNLILPTDLTKRPPRSPRVRLGGFVTLPRILDKCRATLAATNGEYNYNCPLDRHFFDFTGLDANAFKTKAGTGASDAEMLDWVLANTKLHPAQIRAWSEWMTERTPSDVDGREFFHEVHRRIAPTRADVATWFDLLDVDDFASFGGKP